MTFDDIVSIVCKKVGQIDSYSTDLCGEFVNRRYEMIYDSESWSDVLRAAPNIPLVAGTAVYDVPAELERITRIKFGSVTVEPVDYPFMIDSYPDLIAGSGSPRFYVEFTSASDVSQFQLFPIPDDSMAVLQAYGKRTFVPLSGSDEPIIRNIDNCLIAFAQADMLERARQYAKAAKKIEEAGAMLDLLRKVEKDQSNLPRQSKNVTVNGDSLAEMVDGVCCRIGDYSTQIQIMVREYLRREYLDLYDAEFWPELSVIAEMDRDGSEVILPEYFDRVVSVRQNSELGQLRPAEAAVYFGLDPQVFENTGSPLAFSMLTSVGVSILPPTNEALSLVSDSDDDAGVEVEVSGETGGVIVRETVILGGATPVLTAYPYDVPITVAKPLTAGTVTVTGAGSMLFLQSLGPNDREKRHIRLWLQPTPTDSDGTKALILGKRKCSPLVSDADTPILRGIGNYLIHSAAANIFAGRGDDKMAAQMSKKADTARTTLVSREIKQNAFQSQVLPYADGAGYGAEGIYGNYGSKLVL